MPNDKTDQVHSITSMPETGTDVPVVEKRPNVLVRVGRKIKQTPPKTALAVVGGVVLVTAAAVAGRKSAPYHVEIVDSELELEPVLVTPSDESADTVA